MEIWHKLNNAFSPPKELWSKAERAEDPGITDRLVYYLINYFDSPSVARKAVRLFLGIDRVEFVDWNEVKVATLPEIDDALKSVGAGVNSWELAVTIKDFLTNAFDTLETVDLDLGLDDLKPTEIVAYLRQLRGQPEAWKKGWCSPFRPYTSMFQKQCLRYRKENEAVLPENVIQYLEYIMGRTTKSPFEYYANRFLVRLGLIEEQEELGSKINKFNDLIGTERPINKHRQLVQFSKTVCISKPRCQICPLTEFCKYPERVKLEEEKAAQIAAEQKLIEQAQVQNAAIANPTQVETQVTVQSQEIKKAVVEPAKSVETQAVALETPISQTVEEIATETAQLKEISPAKPKFSIAKRKLPSNN